MVLLVNFGWVDKGQRLLKMSSHLFKACVPPHCRTSIHVISTSSWSTRFIMRPHELTACPPPMSPPARPDGLSILDWFENRISAELRLWDAIDQHRLAPFIYYGIYDGLDL